MMSARTRLHSIELKSLSYNPARALASHPLFDLVESSPEAPRAGVESGAHRTPGCGRRDELEFRVNFG